MTSAESTSKAEETAPTHPQPSAKTTTMNYAALPFAAMLDRAHDALGLVTRRGNRRAGSDYAGTARVGRCHDQ